MPIIISQQTYINCNRGIVNFFSNFGFSFIFYLILTYLNLICINCCTFTDGWEDILEEINTDKRASFCDLVHTAPKIKFSSNRAKTRTDALPLKFEINSEVQTDSISINVEYDGTVEKVEGIGLVCYNPNTDKTLVIMKNWYYEGYILFQRVFSEKELLFIGNIENYWSYEDVGRPAIDLFANYSGKYTYYVLYKLKPFFYT